MKRSIVLIVAALIVFASSAEAKIMTVAELASLCDADPGKAQVACHSYISGLVRGFQIGVATEGGLRSANSTKSLKAGCSGDTTSKEIAQLLVMYARRQQEKSNDRAYPIVLKIARCGRK